MTGAERLLADIYRLDQYAFENDRRKLNLAQTFSLAQMAPFEFQRFRETGILPFATPTRLFDAGFPGHYLRLIKRVRTSVVALIPPVQGIRATLIASGISRTVVGGDVFQEVAIRRDSEVVALTSPMNATGVFEMDVQSDMLLPFEAMGVDTSWEFQMPRAANPFDFDSISDVLVTIEYTALNNFDYRQQVIQKFNSRVSRPDLQLPAGICRRLVRPASSRAARSAAQCQHRGSRGGLSSQPGKREPVYCRAARVLRSSRGATTGLCLE